MHIQSFRNESLENPSLGDIDSTASNTTSGERGDEIQEYVATDTESIMYEIGNKEASHLDKSCRRLVVDACIIANETGVQASNYDEIERSRLLMSVESCILMQIRKMMNTR
jgi:hypothetical protein